MPRIRKPVNRELIRNPRSIKELATELADCIDLYWSGDLSEPECRSYISYVAKHHKLLAKAGTDINPTVKKIIGKRRIEIIEKFLEGYQLKLSM